MLPKKIRLTTALFDQVFKTGSLKHSPHFWARSLPSPTGSPSRFAVAVPKKVAPTAILRHKIKRTVYRAVEELGDEFLTGRPSVMTIFGVKKDLSDVPLAEIVEELKKIG